MHDFKKGMTIEGGDESLYILEVKEDGDLRGTYTQKNKEFSWKTVKRWTPKKSMPKKKEKAPVKEAKK